MSLIGGCIAATIGFYVARRIEAHRMLDSIRAIIFTIRDELDLPPRYARSHAEIHSSSIPILRDAISKAWPLVNRKKQERIQRVWSAYRHMDVSSMNQSEFVAAVMRRIGTPMTTAEEALKAMLEHIESELK